MDNYIIQKLKIKSFDKRNSSEVVYSKPEKYREIDFYSKNFKNLITMGAKYSYAPIFFDKSSTSLDLSNFNKILFFSKKKKEITVEAGIKIVELLNFLLKKGFWIPQLPGYPHISVGGAIAANVHGKSCATHGTIRNSVKKLLLFHKKNGWINLNKNKNRELFELSLGGLGLTGTIVTVTFKLTKFNYFNFLTKKYEVNSVSETIKILNKFNKNKKILAYSWNDASSLGNFGRGYVYVSKPITNAFKRKNKLSLKKNFFFGISFWNKYTSFLFNTIFFLLQKFKKNEYLESFEKTVFPFAGKEKYFSFYGYKGFIESQLIIPNVHIKKFFFQLIKYYKKYKPEIILFSMKNMSGKNKYLRFEGNGICVTFDFTNIKKNLNFLKKIDLLCAKLNILPSLIKDSRVPKKIFNQCYKESELFKKRLRKYDKDRIYKSATSIRLKI